MDLIHQYLDWMATAYASATGQVVAGTPAVNTAHRNLMWHFSRINWSEDYIPTVAMEFIDRVNKSVGSGHAAEAFPELVEHAADAVRHRVVRAARHQAGQLPDNIASGKDADDLTVEIEGVFASLTQNERTLMYAIFEGCSIEDTAKRFDVSERTVYRVLKRVREIITARDG